MSQCQALAEVKDLAVLPTLAKQMETTAKQMLDAIVESVELILAIEQKGKQ
jgi:hypothetical protein